MCFNTQNSNNIFPIRFFGGSKCSINICAHTEFVNSPKPAFWIGLCLEHSHRISDVASPSVPMLACYISIIMGVRTLRTCVRRKTLWGWQRSLQWARTTDRMRCVFVCGLPKQRSRRRRDFRCSTIIIEQTQCDPLYGWQGKIRERFFSLPVRVRAADKFEQRWDSPCGMRASVVCARWEYPFLCVFVCDRK